jgi:hypothetical protein
MSRDVAAGTSASTCSLLHRLRSLGPLKRWARTARTSQGFCEPDALLSRPCGTIAPTNLGAPKSRETNQDTIRTRT